MSAPVPVLIWYGMTAVTISAFFMVLGYGHAANKARYELHCLKMRRSRAVAKGNRTRAAKRRETGL